MAYLLTRRDLANWLVRSPASKNRRHCALRAMAHTFVTGSHAAA